MSSFCKLNLNSFDLFFCFWGLKLILGRKQTVFSRVILFEGETKQNKNKNKKQKKQQKQMADIEHSFENGQLSIVGQDLTEIPFSLAEKYGLTVKRLDLSWNSISFVFFFFFFFFSSLSLSISVSVSVSLGEKSTVKRLDLSWTRSRLFFLSLFSLFSFLFSLFSFLFSLFSFLFLLFFCSFILSLSFSSSLSLSHPPPQKKKQNPSKPRKIPQPRRTHPRQQRPHLSSFFPKVTKTSYSLDEQKSN